MGGSATVGLGEAAGRRGGAGSVRCAIRQGRPQRAEPCPWTAEIIAGSTDAPFEEVAGLREISFGEWELRSIGEFAESEPKLFAERGADFAGFRPPGGENFLDLRERVWPAFLGLLGREPGNLLIVAHAGVIKTIIYAILDIPLQKLFSVRLDYCGIQVISRMDGHLALTRLNWTGSLEAD